MTFLEVGRMGNSALFPFSFFLFAFCLVGCFNEPEPAYKSVPAENRVYLSDKGLKAVPAVNPKADYLNLDRNQLESAAGVEKLSELKWLRLNENKLTSLPDLSALKNLRRIYLRDNRLTAVPETLKDLSALTDIELSGNPIKTVPNWLAEKRGLENVSLNRTQITALPEDLSAWKGLKSLQLGELDLPAAEMARIRAALPDVAIVF